VSEAAVAALTTDVAVMVASTAPVAEAGALKVAEGSDVLGYSDVSVVQFHP